MSLKERLAAEKEAALSYKNITKQVEDILVEAAKDGRSSVLIYLDNENDYKTQSVSYFLAQEGISFKKGVRLISNNSITLYRYTYGHGLL